MLFSEGRVRLEITQSKIPLTVSGYYAIFPRRGKTENDTVKNSVKGRQGTMLLPQDRVRLKIIQSKIALTVRFL